MTPLHATARSPLSTAPKLTRQEVRKRMIHTLPEKPSPITFLDWLPEDHLEILKYDFQRSAFGEVLIASTTKATAHIGLVNGSQKMAVLDLQRRFKSNLIRQETTPHQLDSLNHLNGTGGTKQTFHLKGTPFQLKVWAQVVSIPQGNVVSYRTLAEDSRQTRAVGTANSQNPIFYLIPCHRVVRSTGHFDRYFWGETVKASLLAREFGKDDKAEWQETGFSSSTGV